MSDCMRTLVLTMVVLQHLAGLSFADDFRMCIDDWPPYEYVRNNRGEGLSVEVVSAVLARMGHRKPELILASWSRCLESVENGKLHAAFSALKTRERTEYAYYPDEPLILSQWLLFVRKDRLKQLSFKRLADLDGDCIGIVKGFHYPPDFLRYAEKHVMLHTAPTTLTNFRMLVERRIDYVLDDLGVGNYILKTLKAQDEIVPILERDISTEPLYIMFSKRAVPYGFVEEFSKALREFKKTSEYIAILNKYMN